MSIYYISNENTRILPRFRVDEFALLCVMLGILWFFARGLAPGADGMQQRYTVAVTEFPAIGRLTVLAQCRKSAGLNGENNTAAVKTGAVSGENTLGSAETVASPNWNTPQCESLKRQQVQAKWLNLNAFTYIVWLALAGWLSLQLGRLGYIPLFWRMPVLSGLWVVVGIGVGVFTVKNKIILFVLSILPSAVIFVITIAWFWLLKQKRPSEPLATATSRWLYPGWVLLTGMGLIWLLDYSARGHIRNMFTGLEQAHKLYWAYFLLSFSAVAANWLLCSVISLFSVKLGALLRAILILVGLSLSLIAFSIDREILVISNKMAKAVAAHAHGLIFLGIVMMAIGSFLPLLLKIINGAESGGDVLSKVKKILNNPGLNGLVLVPLIVVAGLLARIMGTNESGAGEAARWIFWWVAAWFCYRWIDRLNLQHASNTGMTPKVATGWLLAALGALAMTLFLIIRDNGQTLMAIFSSLVPVVLILLLLWTSNFSGKAGNMVIVDKVSTQWVKMLGAVVISAILVFSAYWILHNHGGSLGGSHVAERLETMASPYASERDFLARLQWGSEAARAYGFGVGNTPWCGWIDSMDGKMCSGGGVPQQIQADYVFNGISMVYGFSVAFALLVFLLFWLFRLPSFPKGYSGQLNSPQIFRSWLLTWMAISLGVQAMMTVTGSLGQALMTGIMLPLMGAGFVGLWLVAILVGLGMNSWKE